MREQVPVIDISKIDAARLGEIDAACRQWGFFQIVGHGIPESEIAEVLAMMSRFFALPVGRKRAIERSADNPWGFYDRELTKNRRDWKEILDIGTDGTPGPFASAKVQWPDELPGFRSVMQRHFDRCEAISYRLLAAIARNLGAEPGQLEAAFGIDHSSYLRLNYYPVCPAPAPPDSDFVPATGALGISHHTDAGALTVLMQDEQPGLQVLRKGTWSLVEPTPGALVINIGDIVQVWSNDEYPAPLHRVLAHGERVRFSAPFFFNPAYASHYAPLTRYSAPHYRSISWAEFRAGRASGDYADVGEEIQISHFRIGASD
jgi:isopenicillin N synthase-like dioxygenase